MALAIESYFSAIWRFISEPTSLFLLLLPLYVIWFASRRSLSVLATLPAPSELSGRRNGLLASSGIRNEMSHVRPGRIQIVPPSIVLLPVVGSAVLLLMFFFMGMLFYAFLGLLVFGAFFGLSFVLQPVVEWLFNWVNGKVFRGKLPAHFRTLNCIGDVSSTKTLTSTAVLCFIVAWLALSPFRHKQPIIGWIVLLLQDVFAVCIAKFAIATARMPDLRYATILLMCFFLYDVFWVFLSPLIFHQSVMVEVATSLVVTERYWELPILIEAPRVFSDGASILGLGDIILPGILICFLYRFDPKPWSGYFLNALIGYAVGMFITQVVLFILREGQPALLYLVPSILIPTYVLGYQREELDALWYGRHKRVYAWRPVDQVIASESEIEMDVIEDVRLGDGGTWEKTVDGLSLAEREAHSDNESAAAVLRVSSSSSNTDSASTDPETSSTLSPDLRGANGEDLMVIEVSDEHD